MFVDISVNFDVLCSGHCVTMSISNCIHVKLVNVACLIVSIRLGLSDAASPIRLAGGANVWQGRVEIQHNNVWGNVCDDHWDDQDCHVACRQLGYSGGTREKHSFTIFGPGTGIIWLDYVKCLGDEASLDQCMHNGWGIHNCYTDGTEDAACICDAPNNVTGVCDVNRHRINYFDDQFKGIGRVEVRDEHGVWGTVCDDNWDDIDAAVFCNCLGYTDTANFRAIWSSEVNNLAQIPMHYDSLHCSASDLLHKKNIWECTHSPYSMCSATSEAAGVACQGAPSAAPPAAPDVQLECNAKALDICFTSQSYPLSKDFLSMDRRCDEAVVRDIQDGVCMNVDMEACQASDDSSDVSYKHYCYDISYSQYDNNIDTLLVDDVWTRRACCSVSKNGSVSSNFEPLVATHSAVQTESKTNFTLECFANEQFQGPPLAFPAAVSRGEEVYCRVSTSTWDPRLYMVVPDCRFFADQGGFPNAPFIQNKCPTNSELGISYYSFDGHNWGFKFLVPKFQGYSELYLSCDSYVCDSVLDDKPYCDRSCQTNNKRRRKRSSEHHVSLHDNPLPTFTKDLTEVRRGPFKIQDEGFGPLINRQGGVVLVRQPASNLYAKSPIAETAHHSSNTFDDKHLNRSPKQHDIKREGKPKTVTEPTNHRPKTYVQPSGKEAIKSSRKESTSKPATVIPIPSSSPVTVSSSLVFIFVNLLIVLLLDNAAQYCWWFYCSQ